MNTPTSAVSAVAVARRERSAPSLAPHARPKILLYSHDTFGLGNIRRSLLLGELFGSEYPLGAVLLMTGSPMIHAFRIPDRMDYVKLPCVNRVNADQYEPQFLLDCTREVRQTRSDILERTAMAFRPDLLIVDKRAAGVDGELMSTLRAIRRCALPTKIVVGIRDIIDEPEATRRSHQRARDLATIARYYDEVWIYGARSVFDAVTEYDFPAEVAAKTQFCGYLKRPTEPRPAYTGPPRVLVTTGGGGDGTDLVTAYLEGLIALPRRVALRTTIVFGPQMPPANRAQLRTRYGAMADVTFVDFEPNLTARYAESDVVVSMAGYNTVCELLSCGARAVLVPRGQPVREQLLRARLLAARGLFDMVEPHELVPDVLLAKVRAALTRPVPAAAIVLDGLSRIRARVTALLADLPR
jgi:predicted glycosyltransferase